MSKLAVLALALSACAATTSPTLERGAATVEHPRVQLDLAAHTDGVMPAFPAAVAPTLPSVDRIQHSVRAALGPTATAQLDLCVSPAGKVTHVALAKSSTFAAFDRALVRDVEVWQFATLPGPASLQSCRRATIDYRMR